MATRKKPKDNVSENVSFRITPELKDLLEKYGSTNKDYLGRALTLGQAARAIVVDALNEIRFETSPTSSEPKKTV